MSQNCRSVFTYIVTLVACMVVMTPSQAQVPAANGIYVRVNPYASGDFSVLQLPTGVTSCIANNSSQYNPFLCGAVNGVLLDIPWCEFQIGNYNQLGSCQYYVQDNGDGTGTRIYPSDDTQSPCNFQTHTFDTCPQSQLGTVLAYIFTLNKYRKLSSLPPLNLSLGLQAGRLTPRSVLYGVGYLDSALLPPAHGGQQLVNCGREPQMWQPQFLNHYESAIDTLLSYIQSESITETGSSSPLRVLKLTAQTADSLEYDVPVHAVAVTAPPDPGPPNGEPYISCQAPPNSTAGLWLATYVNNPVVVHGVTLTFSQAFEWAYGSAAGYALFDLESYPISSAAVLSQAVKGTRFFAEIECGVDETGDPANSQTCYQAVNSNNMEDQIWPMYSFALFIDDLFQAGTVGNTAATTAYDDAGGLGDFPLVQTELSVNATGLDTDQPDVGSAPECWLSNKDSAHDPSFNLTAYSGGNPWPVTFAGTGTIPNWQTASQLQKTLSPLQYGDVMTNGINNGALFIEIWPAAAAVSSYYPPLKIALDKLLTVVPPTHCNYGDRHAKRRRGNRSR